MKTHREDLDDEFYRLLPRAEQLTIQREFLAFPLLVLVVLVLLAVLFTLGILRFPFYQAQAAQNRIARIRLAPPRGEILDRHGRPLAVNHAVCNCYFVTSDDLETDVEDLRELGGFLGLGGDQLDALEQRRREAPRERSLESELWAAGQGVLGARGVLVKRDLDHVEVASLLERKARFPRAFLEQAYRRSYPAGESAALVVGYMGEISQGELGEWSALGYKMGDMVGKAGLERQYDTVLRGRPGHRLVAIDARGRILGEATGIPAVVPGGGAVVVRGDDVAVLSEGEVLDIAGGVRLSLVNGVVRASSAQAGVLRGRPVYHKQDLFEDRGSGGTYGEWEVFRRPGEVAMLNGRVVLRNPMVPPSAGSSLMTTIDLDMQRAIDRIMGDTVGGVVAMDPRNGAILAMVSKPGFDPNLFGPGGVDPSGWVAILEDPHHPLLNRPVQNAYVPGSIFKIVTALAAGDAGLIQGARWTCRGSLEVGDRVFRCWNRAGHGTINFTTAVAESCDVAFWLMAQELGHDNIAEMARTVGLGVPTGIDLPEERGGLIPDDTWKRRRFGERWYLGDTLNMAIGQGFVQTTVLQATRMAACIANGGFLVPPQVNRLLRPAPINLERIPVDQETIDAIRWGMKRCVTDGTGKGCNPDWIALAGKTGTADDPPRDKPHSWFVSFGPYESPRLVIAVFCENMGHADVSATPLARSIWECEPVRAYIAEEE